MQKVEATGENFCWLACRRPVRSNFEISRLDQVFRIFPDTDTALAAT
jgi:anti-anti-sigma regulatory factor